MPKTDLREIITSLQKRGIKIDLENGKFYGSNLSGADLSQVNCRMAIFAGANLSNTQLKNAIFIDTNLCDADIAGAKFSKNTFLQYKRSRYFYGLAKNARDIYIHHEERDLKMFIEKGHCQSENDSNDYWCCLSGLDLQDAVKSLNERKIPINLRYAEMKNANLSGTNLSNALLNNANLEDANLTDATLVNSWVQFTRLKNANLSGTNLSEANLSKAKLNHANLTNANLTKANISGTNFNNAILRNAILRDANIEHSYTEMKNADVTGANVTGVDLSKLSNLGDGTVVDSPARKMINFIKKNLFGK